MGNQKTLVRKGRCLNIGNCNKANKHEIIEVNVGEDFVCPECGGELVEVKHRFPVVPIIAGGIVVVLLLVLLVWKPWSEDLPKPVGTEPTGAVEDSVKTSGMDEESVDTLAMEADSAKIITEEGEDITPVDPEFTGTGTLKFEYGVYVGHIVEGKAQGAGTLTYTKRHRISATDSQGRMAEPGDYVTGDFEDNAVKTVRWYGKDKKMKGAILAGSNGL